MSKDYIPHNAAQFLAYLKHLTDYVGKKVEPASPEWANIPPDRYQALTEKYAAFANSSMASRTPFTLHFEETERGKTVYAGLAWQNERGILGQWSEYKTAVVP
jgi:hypothetical protein